ncbi:MULTISPECIES: prephenate dehydratase [unclassified Nesterenkonia]|uniref:prephenate dehydratase n=1 Tax=unclassified Nesterenkonia TaxID=2629769 RepID=UPI000A8B354D|nr:MULTISPECIES: prephenate dehydratase [unclassified Nesterenkonia]MDS2173332.1 prephenate dehydratase [Nesterenkonia sp. CL21]
MSQPPENLPFARYSYLGPAGTFTEAALLQMPGAHEAERVPAASVLSALTMVEDGTVDAAMVPIENSVEGGVTATLDAVSVAHQLHIVAEALVPITFVVASREPTTLSRIRSLTTHTHAWAQVRRWAEVSVPHAEFIPASSTAAGARALLQEDHAADAAICAPLVAEQLGLHVVAHGVEDVAGAVTRFVLVSKPGPVPEATGADKTTIMIPLPEDRAGALMELLEHFSTRGVNLCRIESRPTGDGLGKYFFSIDLEGHIDEARVADALAGVHRISPKIRFLGSYPRADQRPQQVTADVSEAAFSAARTWIEALRRR